MQAYHIHSNASNIYTPFKDSAVSKEDFAKRAVELGHKVLSSTEHGYQGANYLKVWKLAQEYGLKYVHGAEAYWVKDRTEPDRSNAHIILLARTQKGVEDINDAISEANLTGFYGVPRIDLDILMALDPKDVFVTSACVAFWGKINKQTGELLWHYGKEEDEEVPPTDKVVTDMALQLYHHFGNSFALEVQCHDTPWQKEVNRKCLSLHNKYGIPIIAGTDSHYIYPEQVDERRALREESGVHAFDDDYEMSSSVYEDYPDEHTFAERFAQQGVLSASEIKEAIDYTDIILSFDDITFDSSRKLPTVHPELTQEERNALYEKMVWDGWKQYRKSVPFDRWDEYEDAIRYETHIVTSTNMSDYFLLDSEMVGLAKKYGGKLTPTGRGSAGGFLTNMFLHLTTLDRLNIPVRLYPERFVTAERLQSSVPDADLNVADPDAFVRAQEELLGKGHVFPFVSYGTLRTKAAFKLFARAKNIPAATANEVSKQIALYEKALAHAEEDEQDTIRIEDYVDKEFLPYIKGSEPYLGIIVSKSQAPCGYLLYNGNIRREIGILRINANGGKKTVYCTVIDGYCAEEFGYVKNDILTVTVVKINSAVMERAGLPQYTSSEIMKLAEHDKPTWDIFAKGYTQGINQCQSQETTNKLMVYKPRSVMDLSAFVAAIRPGFKSFLQRFLNREAFKYNVPSFDDILKNDSSGSAWMLYQENTMQCLNMAGFSMEETYPIIKAISKKKVDVIKSAKERFVDGFAKHIMFIAAVDDETAKTQSEMVWQVIEDSSRYSFNACLSGSQRLLSGDDMESPTPTVAEMYNCGDYPRGASLASTKHGIFSYKFQPNDIVDIREAGVQQTYEVYTERGGSIVCTMNHVFETPSGEKPLSELRPGDLVCFKESHTFMPFAVHVGAILPHGEEMTYDVEMAHPWHNFVTDTGLCVHNSHAVSVALDAIYGAYLKAHYPYEYYTVLLEEYTQKGDKDKVAAIKNEMAKAFGIHVNHCRFGEDNRSYLINRETRSISDVLNSAKGISSKVATLMFSLRERKFQSFTDMLYELEFQKDINSGQVLTLIRMGYFESFGSIGKLLDIYSRFYGDKGFKKTLVPASQAKRLDEIRAYEKEIPEREIPYVEQLAFEKECYGMPISTFPDAHNDYLVVSVETKYSPKLKMYSASSGKVGYAKVRKALFGAKPISEGSVIHVHDWKKSPRFGGGSSVARSQEFDLWLQAYDVISSEKVGVVTT